MPSPTRRRRARIGARLSRSVARALARVARMLLVGLAAGFGVAPPRPPLLRHEDPVAEVADDDAR